MTAARHLHAVTDDDTTGRAWRQLSETITDPDVDAIVGISHWKSPDGTMHHKVSVSNFTDLMSWETSVSEESDSLADALDRVRLRINRRDYDR
ncbi:hypothetical protein SEA_MOOSEHEAD_51 [Gordonia phage Moosehead]|nr:hypothetical protein SEA_MOOSEHEAD_51 [Gordonia phage Moosehead]